jgi:hypothetical protein
LFTNVAGLAMVDGEFGDAAFREFDERTRSLKNSGTFARFAAEYLLEEPADTYTYSAAHPLVFTSEEDVRALSPTPSA